MSEEIQSADSLVKENAELRADRALIKAYLSEAREELNEARETCAALRAWLHAVIHVARAVVHHPAEANHTRLQMMLNAYDEATKASDE